MYDWNRPWRKSDRVVLAADARRTPVPYTDDGIWALYWAADLGLPVLETTYGLRARRMRLFPLWFASPERLAWVRTSEEVPPPRWRALAPDYAAYTWTPFPETTLDLAWWVPAPGVVLARLTLQHQGEAPLTVPLGWVADLAPVEGRPMEPDRYGAVEVLTGATQGLNLLTFATAGPRAEFSPWPMLMLDLTVQPGGQRQVTLVHLATPEPLEQAFEAARRWAAHRWDAVTTPVWMAAARMPLVLPEDEEVAWALGVAQQTALRLLHGPWGEPPRRYAVRAREPDHGFSPGGQGVEYGPEWNGLSVPEGWYLSVGFLLPGAVEEAEALFEGFLALQREDGWLDAAPGPAGQAVHALASPLLVDWAERLAAYRGKAFRKRHFAALEAFLEAWLREDADGDGFPEWWHPAQVGVPGSPVWGAWLAQSRGADPRVMEDPALAAMLARACAVLAMWAEALGEKTAQARWAERAAAFEALVQQAWAPRRGYPLRRDRDTHASPPGKVWLRRRGTGEWEMPLATTDWLPLRPVVTVYTEAPCNAQVLLQGERWDGRPWAETLTATGRWDGGRVVLTARHAYRRLERVLLEGAPATARIEVWTPDYTAADLALLALPLWAGVLTSGQAQQTWRRLAGTRGGGLGPWGAAWVPGQMGKRSPWSVAHPFWHLVLVEGLLRYGLRAEAADLLERLWRAAAATLASSGYFREGYDAYRGEGWGGRNLVLGLPPVAPALALLGVEACTPKEVRLGQPGAFAGAVRLLWQGVEMEVHGTRGVVRFPEGVEAAWAATPARVVWHLVPDAVPRSVQGG